MSQRLPSLRRVTPAPARDEIYCFCTLRRRRNLSAYLVRRVRVGPVVARIEPLGDVRTAATEAELLALGLQRRVWIAGPWRATASGRHALVRVRPLPEGSGA